MNVLNQQSSCVRGSGDMSCLYQSGNNICCIFEEPGDAEIELRMPVAGATGANLCRLFEAFKGKSDKVILPEDVNRTCFCRWSVTIVNARYCGRLPSVDYIGTMVEKIRHCNVILAFGVYAAEFCDDIKRFDKDYFRNKYLIKMVHLSHQGLAWIVDKESQKKCSEKDKLRFLADFIMRCLVSVKVSKEFGRKDFEEMLPKCAIRKPCGKG